jgi:hypothetical protein
MGQKIADEKVPVGIKMVFIIWLGKWVFANPQSVHGGK